MACIDKLELEWKSDNNQPCSNKQQSEAILEQTDLTLGTESDLEDVIAIPSTS